ncbi:MAG: penicillin-binding protein family, partial [Conexibacter sp.]|nr:penicillin-binding protein family [Conexibacter sp.]
MSDDGTTPTPGRAPSRLIPFRRRRRRREGRPRIRKLRLLSILAGLFVIALISTVFGMMMAVASDLPGLENRKQYSANKNNSVLLDYKGRQLSVLTNNQNVVLVNEHQIAPAMKHAIIATEDRNFYSNQGFDVKGIGRAIVQDVTSQRAAQGASTITQQFVKNALAAQSRRTVFEKLREAALAYHLTRKWSKEKILTEYLNSIYFGNGAYGIESAARVYFGKRHGYGEAGGCGSTGANMCAFQLTPPEAALIAGMVASPSMYDPVAHPVAARRRRDHVLRNMRDQGYITPSEYVRDVQSVMPARQTDLVPPQERSEAPYFTSWVRQQVVDTYGTFRAFNGGLRVTTSLDLDMQHAAQNAISAHLPAGSGLPTASLVAIDNRTGEVRAMANGTDYASSPFNLATLGQRQPGSTFKPFIFAAALQNGISPDRVYASQRKLFTVPNTNGQEHFVVQNDEGLYSGSISLGDALISSDNSVFSEVGIDVGTTKVARVARRMGIRTPISTNYAMTLGGLRQGVTPLDMAHAYETIATGGNRIWNKKLGAAHEGPIGIHKVEDRNGSVLDDNTRSLQRDRVVSPDIASTVTQYMQGVVQSGTGRAAQLTGFAAGKTGTTSNYGDAWFVGWNEYFTVAVWVGYPDKLVPMQTQYNGGPVLGGTYPAEIWHDFMTSAGTIITDRKANSAQTSTSTNGTSTDGSSAASAGTPPPATSGGTTTSGAGTGTTDTNGTGGGNGGTTGAGGGGGNTGAGGGTGGPRCRSATSYEINQCRFSASGAQQA